MAISAEELNIILAAKDKQFKQAMDANARKIEKFSKKANKDLGGVGVVFAKLAGAAAGLASVAIFQQLGASVRAAADRLGDLADAAASIGITTDALQELRYAAQLSGVQQEALQTSLTLLSRNLGTAASGMGAAKKSLDQMGLSAADLVAMPLPDALAKIADKMAEIESPAVRAAMAADLFGRSGVAMVPMLIKGADGMAALRKEANDLGVVVDESIIKKAEDAGDKLDALSLVISSNLTAALIDLAPFLIDAAQGIASLAVAAREFLSIDAPKTLEERMFGLTPEEMAEFATETENLVLAREALNAIEVSSGRVPPTIQELDAAHERVRLAEEALATAKAEKAAREAATGATVASIKAKGEENEALREEIRLAGMSNEERVRAVALKEKEAWLAKTMADYYATMKPGEEPSAQVEADIFRLADANYELAVAAGLAAEGQKKSAGATRTAGDEAEIAARSLEIYTQQVANLGLTLEGFEGIASTVQSSMSDAFMSMVDGTKTAEQAFKDMARSVIAELYEVLVVQKLVGQFATATSAGSGILGAISSGLGITGHASGGAVYPGQPAVVGEHGKEVFVPSSAGRILSVPQAKAAVNGGGGSVVVNQTISISTGVQQTVRAEIQSMMPQIAGNTTAAILDARRRGGKVRAAFGG